MKHLVGRLVKGSAPLERAARRAAGLLPYPVRMGPHFRAFHARLAAMEHASPAELRELSLRETLAALRFAYARSPFYRRLYDEHGVKVSEISTFDELSRQVPLTGKEMLAAAADLTVPQRGASLTMTSGTNGSPFAFPIDPRALAMEAAAIYHQWSRAGFRPGDVRVEMRGYQTEPIVRVPDADVVRFSVVNMERHLDEMVAFLNRSRIPFLHGYPSALAKFALLLRERGLRIDHPLRGVFLASENVYPWQTALVEEVLRPAVLLAHYGTAERTVLGAWCEGSRAYHFLPLYGHAERGPEGQIVGTGFLNRATPFVRYASNDVVLDWSDAPCPHCGRGYAPRVEQIGGRLEDYMVDERGELVPPAVVTFPFKNLRFIRSVQIEQRRDRSVLLRCVADAGPADAVAAERDAVRRGLHKVLGASLPVEFEDVDEIPLTAACKFKWIVSEAARPRLAEMGAGA